MKNIFLGILLVLIIFSGCCDKTYCNQVKVGYENTFYFLFDTDIQNKGFLPQELDTIYLEKYEKGKLYNSYLERWTVNSVVMLGEDAKPEFKNFDYVLTSPDSAFRFEITELQVNGEEYKNKCSSCYHNTQKICKVNGIIQDRSGSNEYILLQKP